MDDINTIKNNVFRMLKEGASEKDVDDYLSIVSPKEQPSALESFGRGALQGGTLNYGDEIYGAYKGAINSITGKGNFLDTYTKERDAVREANKSAQEANPYYYLGGELAGGVALPLGSAVGAAKVTGTVAQPLIKKSLGQMVKEGSALGAGYGGVTSFGAAEGTPEEQALQTVVGTGIGGAAGAVLPIAGKVISNAAAPVWRDVQALTRPTEEALHRVKLAKELDDEAAQAANRVVPKSTREQAVEQRAQELIDQGLAGGDMRLIDTGGENMRALARSAANNSPSAREILTTSTDQTFKTQGDRFYNFLRSKMALPGNSAETREELETRMRQLMRPMYQRAYDAGDKPIWSSKLQRLAGADEVRNAMLNASKTANSRAIAEGYGGFNTRVQLAPDGVSLQFVKGKNGVPSYPNLQFWDSVKQGLDDLASSSKRAGANNEANYLGLLSKELRTELDKLVPEYAPARGVAANYFNANNAIEAGEKFAKSSSAYSLNEATKIFNRMPAHEKQMFQEGYFSSLLEDVASVGDKRTILNKFANSMQSRKELELVFGRDKALDVEAFLHIEQLQDLMRTALGNSKTAQFLQEMALGGTGGLGVALSGGDFNGQKSTLYTILGALLLPAGSKARSTMVQKMATNIAELLSTRDPQLLMRTVNITRNNPTAMNMLRQASARASQMSAAANAASETTSSPRFQGLIGSQMGMTADNLPQ